MNIQQKHSTKLIFNVFFPLFLYTFILHSCNNSNQKTITTTKVVTKAINLETTRYPNGPMILWSYVNNSVLDIVDGSRTSNSTVCGSKISGGNTQFWLIQKKDNAYVIRSYYSTNVLAINLVNFSVVQQCFNGNDNQLWNLSGTKDSLRLQNVAIKKYLTITNNKLSIKTSNRSNDNLWKLKSHLDIQNEGLYCNCEENFKAIKARVESSYSGFQDKVTLQTQAKYDSICTELLIETKKTENTITCYKLLNSYVSFFNDGHLHLDITSGPEKNQKITGNVGAAPLQIQNFNDSTLLFSLPSFNPKNKDIIDNLIKANKIKLLQTPYLIIDVRNNGGGSDATWKDLIPYIYTNPIKYSGVDFLASDETIKKYDALYESDENYKQQRKLLLKERKKNKTKFVTRNNNWTQTYDSITKNPKRIAILINKKCASSTEEFLLAARQSKKVILMGQPTSGTLDYSNVIEMQCPSSEFKLTYATTRSKRLPKYSVDKEKIKPDIHLQDNEDWIKKAVEKLNK